MNFTDKKLRAILERVVIKPRRFLLATPGVEATVPMLRGTWGAALHGLNPAAYDAVFTGRGPVHERTPCYQLSPAPPDAKTAPAVDFTVIGPGIAHDEALMRAWDVASGMGLGKEREPFSIREIVHLGPDGGPPGAAAGRAGWPLGSAMWPVPGPCESAPCVLVFDAPLRLIRSGGLVETPTPADIAVAVLRRLVPFVPPQAAADLGAMKNDVIAAAREIPTSGWEGRKSSFHRWSSAQSREIDLHGVCGRLALPAGPGSLWRLFAAAQWLYIGKGTSMGLGRVTRIEGVSGLGSRARQTYLKADGS